MIIMILGIINFVFYYFIFIGNYKEGIRNVEIKSFFIIIIILSFFGVVVLKGIYLDGVVLFRKIFYYFVFVYIGIGFVIFYL